MSTAIVINRVEVGDMVGQLFSLKGNLFSPDLNSLGNKIQEALDEVPININSIVLDISQAHVHHFKPWRLFGLCTHFYEKLKQSDQKIVLQIIVTEEHAMAFPDVKEFAFSVLVKNKDEETIDYLKEHYAKLAGLNMQSTTYSKFASAKVVDGGNILFTKFKASETTIRIKYAELSYYITWSISLVCLLSLIFSFIYYYKSLYGFALSFSSGILLIESFLIIQSFRKSALLKKSVEDKN